MKDVNVNKKNLTIRLQNYLSEQKNPASGPGIEISKFSDLVKEVAELSYLNQDYMLFYRGQLEDYQNATKTGSSLYPNLYRDRTNKKNNDINLKVTRLNKASEVLVEEIKKRDIIGKEEIIKKRYIQWSILQHYGVCDTPLLDVTHSLRVACSFAFDNNQNDWGYIYVLALPYVTHRISTNSEQETIIVRLLSISPPQALRPYYQDGYLVGTEFVIEDFDNKQELDLVRRLVSKYKIKNNNSFWDQDVNKISSELLYPNDDEFIEIANEIENRLSKISYDSDDFAEEYGKFMLKWIEIEKHSNNQSAAKVFNSHYKNNVIGQHLYEKIQRLRTFRNNLVHNPNFVSINDLKKYNIDIQETINELKNRL